ncbi:hypothetical protein HN807_09485 [Candidatus Bathyarchaeota archaeon]|nr:hypothetical protein [Candidatus Bathyarchaeota archaeon]MBT4320707.1 hypothetical protein [Candidatus Bathyarchaeota archaeon]MBT4424268.1 hypothetical protein [Candidatus Bathyarchaeota archaeon]MBT5643398.1 hypothetical protein [Candidatus Bathyarchaeota archaeon]MBT6604261.1 hypothetical protein [Candidatus Bathyarchaeota archaeon]
MLKTIHGVCILLSLGSLVFGGLPLIVVWSSIIAYPLMAVRWLNYMRREISGVLSGDCMFSSLPRYSHGFFSA